MEKKTRTIGILLLVLLALLITFFGLKKWNTSKSEAEEKKKENAVVHIFETDSLESIEYKEASGEEMSFVCLLYTSPSPRDVEESRMPSSA